MTMTRYLVLTKYDEGLDAPPMAEWDPDDITALTEYVRALNQELIENGELAVRGHLREMLGETDPAVAHYRSAATRTLSAPERQYLLTKAARLNRQS